MTPLVATAHAGHADEFNVLRKRRVRKRFEAAAEDRAESVGAQTAH